MKICKDIGSDYSKISLPYYEYEERAIYISLNEKSSSTKFYTTNC